MLDSLERTGTDFTLAFRRLSETQAGAFPALVKQDELLVEWLTRYQARCAREKNSPEDRADAMRRVNPIYIPRNHQVEAALAAAVEEGDLGPFNRLHAILASPFVEVEGLEAYAEAAGPSERVFQTFCGT